MVRKQYRCLSETCGNVFSTFKERDDESIPNCICGSASVRDYSGVQVSMPHIHAPGGLKDWTQGKSHADQAAVYLDEKANPY